MARGGAAEAVGLVAAREAVAMAVAMAARCCGW